MELPKLERDKRQAEEVCPASCAGQVLECEASIRNRPVVEILSSFASAL